eukprot:4569567-Alexandrium_andersonii.AAC.1
MKDATKVVPEIQKFAEENAGVAKHKHKTHAAYTEWQQSYGQRASELSRDGLEPWEHRECILDQINKYGRTEDRAQEMWDEHRAVVKTFDYKGDKGQLRLWLPCKSKKETLHE